MEGGILVDRRGAVHIDSEAGLHFDATRRVGGSGEVDEVALVAAGLYTCCHCAFSGGKSLLFILLCLDRVNLGGHGCGVGGAVGPRHGLALGSVGGGVLAQVVVLVMVLVLVVTPGGWRWCWCWC